MEGLTDEWLARFSDSELLKQVDTARRFCRAFGGRSAAVRRQVSLFKQECRRRGLMAESRKAKPRFPRAAG